MCSDLCIGFGSFLLCLMAGVVEWDAFASTSHGASLAPLNQGGGLQGLLEGGWIHLASNMFGMRMVPFA